MAKQLENQYPVDTPHLTPDEMRRALSGDFDGFKYFFENCMLLQDRDTRQYVHPKMNRGQEMICQTIFRCVAKETRSDKHKEVVIIGPRQFGKSTALTASAGYIEAYVPGMENLNLVTTMHTSDAATKYFKQKMEPILTSVHPDIFPTIERDSSVSSTLLKYKDIKGIPRGGYYEILSAGSNSVRSGTVSVWLCDEPSEYRNPEMVEDAVSGAISSYGFSFTAYIGTFSDRLSTYFLDKIKTAIDNPDEMELIFIPWFLVYGREGDDTGVDLDNLKDYEKNVIIPEMIKWGVPASEWCDKIGWYRTRALRTAKMRYEFPSSIDDIMKLTSDQKVFSEDSIENQKKNIIEGTPYRLITDNLTKKVEAEPTDNSPFRVFRKPTPSHRYKVVVDPITAISDSTDTFAMIVMDDNNLEQVAVFQGRGLPLEDYADYAVSIAKIYNQAMIVPESNVAAAFVTSVYNLRYYNLYYESQVARRNRNPGIRTTATSKENMVDNLKLLLETNKITLHDAETIDELSFFEKKVKERSGGGTTVRMAARKGHFDDLCACLWIYTGTLTAQQLAGKKRSKFTVL